MLASSTPRNVSYRSLALKIFHMLTYLYDDEDLEDVGQQLIEDNIVSVSRQMIDKEASVAKTNAENGHQNGVMDVDEEL